MAYYRRGQGAIRGGGRGRRRRLSRHGDRTPTRSSTATSAAGTSLPGAAPRGRRPLAGRGISARQRRALKARGVATPARAGRPAAAVTRSSRASAPARWSGSASRRGSRSRARTRRDPWELLPLERDDDGALVPDRGLPGPARADAGRPVLRHRGRPVRARRRRRLPLRRPRAWRRTTRRGPASRVPRHLEPRRRGVTRAAEKAAFERLVDLVIDRLGARPDMHVYHYAAYERTALGRLMQRHAHPRGGGRPPPPRRRARRPLPGRPPGRPGRVESYSIKRLEPLYALRARGGARRTPASSIVAFETWLELGSEAPVDDAAASSTASRATTATTS